MTINKLQGQSFHTVGLDLWMPVFSYGQFYVAVSYILSIEGLSILLLEHSRSKTLNVTYPEVLVDLLE
jgi:ATP-dependent DNA helicase PIF1